MCGHGEKQAPGLYPLLFQETHELITGKPGLLLDYSNGIIKDTNKHDVGYAMLMLSYLEPHDMPIQEHDYEDIIYVLSGKRTPVLNRSDVLSSVLSTRAVVWNFEAN